MLSYHDPSGGLGVVHGDELSPDNDYQQYTKHHRQHELDELETSKARQCLKKTTKFLFSHIGLVGLVVVYSIAGGFLFQLLEVRQERLNCLDNQAAVNAAITQFKQNLVNYIQNNATPSSNSASPQDNITVAYDKIASMLYNFRTYLIQTNTNYRSFGENCSIVNKWTYPNSLLFAITIITTIGYGNITPMTWEGQLCCICYATIGIPIFLLCVANISGVLGEMFRFLYSKLICGPCSFVTDRRAKARKTKLEEESGISSDHTRPSEWTLNDNNTKTSGNRLSHIMTTGPEVDEDELKRNQRVAVPLTVTMIIIAAYIWIGSAVFHSFEGWTMIQSGYFCFITLSTIGFGDFVPGQQPGDKDNGAHLIIGAIYVLFGMAILAMCFDLMQEEIVAKFRWIGSKVGIIEKADENTDHTDKISESKSKRSSTINDPNAPMNTNHTIINNENGIESPTNRNSSATRKSSPRNNIARIHPIETTSPPNGATLHQRLPPIKPH